MSNSIAGRFGERKITSWIPPSRRNPDDSGEAGVDFSQLALTAIRLALLEAFFGAVRVSTLL